MPGNLRRRLVLLPPPAFFYQLLLVLTSSSLFYPTQLSLVPVSSFDPHSCSSLLWLFQPSFSILLQFSSSVFRSSLLVFLAGSPISLICLFDGRGDLFFPFLMSSLCLLSAPQDLVFTSASYIFSDPSCYRLSCSVLPSVSLAQFCCHHLALVLHNVFIHKFIFSSSSLLTFLILDLPCLSFVAIFSNRPSQFSTYITFIALSIGHLSFVPEGYSSFLSYPHDVGHIMAAFYILCRSTFLPVFC